MTKTVEFYFDFGSPTAYLAHKRLAQLREQYDFNLQFRPMLLGGVFKATGNTTPVAIPAKGKYMLEQDLPRFSQLYDVPLVMNPFFPINTLNLMRGAFAALELNCFEVYADTVFDAVWVQAENMGDAEVVERVLNQAGLPGQELLALSQSQDIKTRLIDSTNEAVERGIFGAPTMFLDNHMLFGQDRLFFLEMELQK